MINLLLLNKEIPYPTESIWFSKPSEACENYAIPGLLNELIWDFTCASVTTPAAWIASSSNNEICWRNNLYHCFGFMLGFYATIWLTILAYRSSIPSRPRLHSAPSQIASSKSLPVFSVFVFAPKIHYDYSGASGAQKDSFSLNLLPLCHIDSTYFR